MVIPGTAPPEKDMPVRMIALDLDGTLLDPDGRIRPATVSALAAAAAAGVDVVLVTGRHHSVTRPYQDELGLLGSAICCNGTYVYDFAAGCIVDGAPIPDADARALIAQARRHGVDLYAYTADCMYYEVPSPHLDKLATWIDSLATRPKPVLRHVASALLLLDRGEAIWKFVGTHDDADRLSGWFAEVEAIPTLSAEYSWHDRVDVMSAGCSKGARLVSWAASRGIAAADIVAFGDNFNDLTMLTGVGCGIAMGNAPDAVKAVATEVIGANDSDAIAERVTRLIG